MAVVWAQVCKCLAVFQSWRRPEAVVLDTSMAIVATSANAQSQDPLFRVYVRSVVRFRFMG